MDPVRIPKVLPQVLAVVGWFLCASALVGGWLFPDVFARRLWHGRGLIIFVPALYTVGLVTLTYVVFHPRALRPLLPVVAFGSTFIIASLIAGSILSVHRGFAPPDLFLIARQDWIGSPYARAWRTYMGDSSEYGILGGAGVIVAILMAAKSSHWRKLHRWSFVFAVLPPALYLPTLVLAVPSDRAIRVSGNDWRVREDGSIRVLWSDDGLRIGDFPGEERLRVPGTESMLNKSAISEDGRWLATADYGGRIRIWNPITGMIVNEMPREKKSVHDLYFLGDRLIRTRGGSSPTAFDPDSGDLKTLGDKVPFIHVSTHMGFSKFALSPDLAFSARLEQEGVVVLTRTQSSELIRKFDGMDGVSRPSMIFSSDSRRFAICTDKRRIVVIDVATRAEKELVGQEDPTSVAVFSPEGNVLLYWSGEGKLWAWDLASGTGARIGGGTYGNAVFSPDGRYLGLATRGETLEVRRVSDQTLVKAWNVQKPGWWATMAFSLDNREFVFCTDEGKAGIWRLGEDETRMLSIDNNPQAIAFSKEHGPLVHCDDIGRVSVWRLRETTRTFHSTGHEPFVSKNAALSPDGSHLACVGFGETRVFRVENGSVAARIPIDWKYPMSVSYSNKGGLLAVGNVLFDASTGTQIRKFQEESVIVFGPSDSVLAVVKDGVTVIDLASERKLARFPEAVDCAFSPAGRYALIKAREGPAVIYSLPDGTRKHVFGNGFFFFGERHAIRPWSFSADDRLFAWTEDRLLRVVEVDGWRNVVQFSNSPKLPHLAFSSSGKRIASLSDYAVVSVWDVRTRRLLGTIVPPLNDRALQVFFSPSEKTLYVQCSETLRSYLLD